MGVPREHSEGKGAVVTQGDLELAGVLPHVTKIYKYSFTQENVPSAQVCSVLEVTRSLRDLCLTTNAFLWQDAHKVYYAVYSTAATPSEPSLQQEQNSKRQAPEVRSPQRQSRSPGTVFTPNGRARAQVVQLQPPRPKGALC